MTYIIARIKYSCNEETHTSNLHPRNTHLLQGFTRRHRNICKDIIIKHVHCILYDAFEGKCAWKPTIKDAVVMLPWPFGIRRTANRQT